MSAVANEALAAARPALLRVETRADGVAILTMDDPNEPHNTITPAFGEELTRALAGLEADPKVIAVVLSVESATSFLAGAKIDFVRAIKFADEAEAIWASAGERLAALAKGTKPVVACVHGPALGGGFELALACTAAVASDDAKTVLGLPEVKLGLMPAANGLLRVAERAGLQVAVDVGLTGRNLRPKKALALGLVDEVCAAPVVLAAACRLAKTLAERPEYRRVLPRIRRARSARGVTKITRTLLERTPLGLSILFRRARAEAAAKTRGHYPAPLRMLDVLERWSWRGFGPAAKLEARLFGELVVSETSHRMIELFFATTAMKKDTGLEENETAAALPIAHVTVLGAGLMGAGIAGATIEAGITVRMKDRDDDALGRGLRYIRGIVDERVRRGSLSIPERDRLLSRLGGATDFSGMRRSDVVIEAVFEDLALKHEVVKEIEKIVSPDCAIASNTSAIPIARIADAASRPERVVGMHYFSPVHKMPLLEVIRTPASDPRAIATAVALGKRQGKTVIVVRDGTAFYTTRILVPYMNEASHLLAEGVPIEAIDEALVDWGFPVGALQLLDEVGIDVAEHVATATEEAFGERMRAPASMRALAKDDRKGRKNGRGFYMYNTYTKERRVDPTVYEAVSVTRGEAPMPEEISLRCSLALVNEALRCKGEGILRNARDGDVGAIFGIGFPAFRGGPFRYVDVVGASEILSRTRSLEQRFGKRFEPAPLLVEMARAGKRFYT